MFVRTWMRRFGWTPPAPPASPPACPKTETHSQSQSQRQRQISAATARANARARTRARCESQSQLSGAIEPSCDSVRPAPGLHGGAEPIPRREHTRTRTPAQITDQHKPPLKTQRYRQSQQSHGPVIISGIRASDSFLSECVLAVLLVVFVGGFVVVAHRICISASVSSSTVPTTLTEL